MNSKLYLITGPSGSGKTALCNYFGEDGYQTIEADSTPGLCYFVDKRNKPVPYPAGADAAWWETHNYVWELDRLAKLVRNLEPSTKPVFFCGNSGNIDAAMKQFAGVFYLDIPADIMLGRIEHGARDHSFGQRVEDRDQLVRWAPEFKAKMLELGAISIDATKPLDKVASAILKKIKANSAK